jgi:type IV secretion system protein VirB9
MPYLQFSYPVHQDQAWGSFIATQRATNDKVIAEQQKTKKKQERKEQSQIEQLVTNYTIDGVAPWKPRAVYHDGLHTYIRFPDSAKGGELPVLLVMSTEDADDKDLIQVNYRVLGNVMKVDYVVERGVLVAGVDDAQHRIMFSLQGKAE